MNHIDAMIAVLRERHAGQTAFARAATEVREYLK
jgi:hypothetical protein